MSLKKKFQFKDRLIKGIDPDGQFKISVVKTTDVVKTAQQNHNLSLLNTVLLGKTLTASMLLASELKGEERIQVRIEGSGPVGMLTAEANRVGEVRGYSANPSAELDYSHPDTTIGDGLGAGILTVTKTLYNEAEPRRSSIELVAGDINADVAHFMAQSEQILSGFLLDVSLNDDGSVKHAGGVLVQRLPEAEEEKVEQLQKTLTSLPPLSELFENDYYIDDIMEMATKPFSVKELDRQPVHFFCRCSPKRFKNALSMLGYEDLKEMEGESQEVVCNYCGTKMEISKEEIAEMAETAKAKLN
ncbi:Hsp33 family molecular chaperone HslO [Rhodohalobacter barkolensis]|uniref:33 kDa chaperonin n=1 Tax=Rhodohalobacter barkolensis TaxID=2053187 RepID=A0A2N0VE84_9BACT|nr:Hsp33 family molecular chaperone HslO [Rhodohalobacter barkolensis]PKD42506.1 Hsp33 family molecular chaperone HslO [Rhodohalobacter barkolensis]